MPALVDLEQRLQNQRTSCAIAYVRYPFASLLSDWQCRLERPASAGGQITPFCIAVNGPLMSGPKGPDVGSIAKRPAGCRSVRTKSAGIRC